MDPVIERMLGSVSSRTLLATQHRRSFSANGTHHTAVKTLGEWVRNLLSESCSLCELTPILRSLAS